MNVGPFFTYELEEPIAPLIHRLHEMGELTRRQSSVWIECTASFSDSAPDLELRPPAVLELAELRAGLTVALNYRSGGHEAETAAGADTLHVQAFLRLSGTFDPAEITKLMGMSPTRVWRAGDLIGSGSARARSDNWEIAGRQSEDLNIQLTELRSAVGAKTALVRTTARENGAETRIEVTWRYRPGTSRVTLEPRDIQFAGELGALIEFDPIAG